MNQPTEVYYFKARSGQQPIKEFLDSLSKIQQAKLIRVFKRIQEYGLSSVLSHTKKLKGTPLWEIRILGGDNIRVIYVVINDFAILVLHGFIKKTQKTSQKDLTIVLNRYYEWRGN